VSESPGCPKRSEGDEGAKVSDHGSAMLYKPLQHTHSLTPPFKQLHLSSHQTSHHIPDPTPPHPFTTPHFLVRPRDSPSNCPSTSSVPTMQSRCLSSSSSFRTSCAAASIFVVSQEPAPVRAVIALSPNSLRRLESPPPSSSDIHLAAHHRKGSSSPSPRQNSS
jgi:hypothetical protein